MKKIFNKYYWTCTSLLCITGIICAISLTCCSEPSIKNGTISADKIIEGNNFRNIYKFKFENHDYIMFETDGLNSATAGVVHSPECKYCQSKHNESKHTNKNEQTQSELSSSD